MAAESAKEFEALEAQATTLLDLFRRAGYEQVAPAIIQPADIFLDQIGEQIRSRTYVFTDLAGDELCLRPDLTVPVSRLYLERHPKADQPARYCYNGPAFRFQPQGDNQAHPREFRQAGIECFGKSDKESADVEIVLLAVEAVRGAGLKNFRLRFGDIALFYALLDALALPERWRLKLRHYFWRPQAFHALLARLARGERPNGDGPTAALAESLAGLTTERAEELIGAYLDKQGLPLSGNRTLGEITARLLDHAADLRAEPLPREVATVIDYYLAVSAPPKEAAERIAMIAKGAGLDLGPALYATTRRFERLAKSGIDLGQATFATEFGRSLEYYSGLVFQIEVAGLDEAIGGGGRYDGLLSYLGAPKEVPAIGSAIHTERLLEAAGEGRVMAAKLLIAVPSKGRLKDQAASLFEGAGAALRNKGHERGYRGTLDGIDGVEVVFTSAAEIVHELKSGRVHLGLTGEDLIRETLVDVDGSVEFLKPLGFGRADVVVAVPDCWIDVARMADLEDVAAQFASVHGRRLRVATKYTNLTRRFFASHGVAGYRTVESVGATEATPAAGTAELIVDITTTGTTLRANHLKVLEDGLILKSQAHLFASRAAPWTAAATKLRAAIVEKLPATK